ncbi:hypothetical protein T484DRAFT_1971403 [Baffinella frigidus]|nr:hypothetical protein T484DRAFT_1971403 [Cryptophyta sp. CCMP2293]
MFTCFACTVPPSAVLSTWGPPLAPGIPRNLSMLLGAGAHVTDAPQSIIAGRISNAAILRASFVW